MKLRGRPEASKQAALAHNISRASDADIEAVHGPLERLLGRVEMTNREEIPRADGSELVRLEGNDSLRVAGCGDELDLNCLRRVDLNDSANVSALQAVTGQISCNRYCVEKLEGHWLHLRVCSDESRCCFTAKYNPDGHDTCDASIGPRKNAPDREFLTIFSGIGGLSLI